MSEGWRRCRVCHAEKAASALDETGRCHGCATAAAATDAGMTYGKYTALRRSGLLPKQVALQARINRQRFAGIYCKNCGQRIPEGSEGLCCQECREKWEQQEKDSEERGIFLQPTKPEEKKPRFCRNCGKPVTGKNNTATADVDTSAIRHTSCCFKGNTGKEKRRKRRVNEAILIGNLVANPQSRELLDETVRCNF